MNPTSTIDLTHKQRDLLGLDVGDEVSEYARYWCPTRKIRKARRGNVESANQRSVAWMHDMDGVGVEIQAPLIAVPDSLRNSNGKVSKTKLNEYVRGWFGIENVIYEAYGRQVHAYLTVPEGVAYGAVLSALRHVGLRPEVEYNRYNREHRRLSFTNISYFRARGWNS